MPRNAIEPKSVIWNPWHGCHKLSAGCMHCYVYRGDAKRGVDSSVVTRTRNFDLPLKRKRTGEYKIPEGSMVYTCFTSDFLLDDADPWRAEAWDMMRQRTDLRFMIITKRIHRLQQVLPPDWGQGYEHVTLCCTVENEECARYRLPIYREAPIRHKIIICEPLLGDINLQPFDIGTWIEQVVVGGESGQQARPCHYNWVLHLRSQCVAQGVAFWYKQTGAQLIKDNKLYYIKRSLQHAQARKAGINFVPIGK